MKFLRFLASSFVAFAAVCAAKAGTLSASNISVTFTHSGGTFTVVNASALSSGANTDDVLGQAYLNRITALGGSITGGDLWVLTATGAAPNPDTVTNYPISITAGYFYRLTVRTLTRTTPGVNAWHVTGINTYEFTGGTADSEKRVRVAGTNTSSRPIRLVVRSGASDIIGTIDVAPGAVYNQTFTVSDAQDAAGIHLDTFVQDQFTDGVWIQKDTMDSSTATKVGSQTMTSVTLPPGGIPDAGYQAYSNRGPSSGPPSATTSTGGVWTSTNYVKETADADRLDKATFREGIDKLENVLKGDAGEVPAPPEDWNDSLITTPENPNKLLEALPAVPAISGPAAPVKSVTIALQFPGITVPPVTIDFDNSATAVPIALFRAIMLAVVSLAYLILSIKTIRGAFAGK